MKKLILLLTIASGLYATHPADEPIKISRMGWALMQVASVHQGYSYGHRDIFLDIYNHQNKKGTLVIYIMLSDKYTYDQKTRAVNNVKANVAHTLKSLNEDWLKVEYKVRNIRETF